MAFHGSLKLSLLLLMAVLMLFIGKACGHEVQRKTPLGTFIGTSRFMHDAEVESYLGIRYGEAPVHEKRFKEVQIPHTNEFTTIRADKLPNSCPQLPDTTFEGHFQGAKMWNANTELSEDCLFLNVLSPIKKEEKDKLIKKPVFVWIYGGGFISGTSTLDFYSGVYLAPRLNVVFVSFQYRLGSLGFLYTGDSLAPGNAGLKDQVLALRWIHNYIEYFGGDKNRITLVGESAGSASVGYHLLSPDTSKLFERAIMLSGSPTAQWAYVSPIEARQRAFSLAGALGANVSDYQDVSKTLINARWSDIVRNQFKVTGEIITSPFVPTIEPSLVPEHPLHLLKNANHLRNKTIIASWTKDEGSLFLMYHLVINKIISNVTNSPHLNYYQFEELMSILAHKNQTIKKNLTVFYNSSSPEGYLPKLTAALGDRYIKCPVNYFVKELKKHGAIVYQLEFDYRSPTNPWPRWMGVIHAYELEFFFGVPLYVDSKYIQSDRDVSNRLMDHTASFIHRGDPNVPKKESWYQDKLYAFTYNMNKNADARTQFCNKFDELMPDPELSTANGQRGNLFLRLVAALLFLALRVFG